MFNSDMLEVAIGLIFTYLLFSFVATAARESFEALAKKRGRMLENGIRELVRAPTAAAAEPGAAGSPDPSIEILTLLYRSAPVFGLFRGDYAPPSERKEGPGKALTGKLPSYIPGPAFVQGVLDVIGGYANANTAAPLNSFDRLQLALEAVPSATLRDAVRPMLQASGGDLAKVKASLELWYAGAMDRAAGQYRRRTQAMVFLGSLLVAVMMNVNTIVIVQSLSQDSALRSAIVGNAGLVVADPQLPSDKKLKVQTEELGKIGLPIGWTPSATHRIEALGNQINLPFADWRLSLGWGVVLMGWLMTAFAVSLGAPFWFDVLNKFMVVRATVKPREKSKEERSKDGAERAQDPPNAAAGGAFPTPAPTPTSDNDPEIENLDPTLRPREGDVDDATAAGYVPADDDAGSEDAQ